jgi:hypothetical protein
MSGRYYINSNKFELASLDDVEFIYANDSSAFGDVALWLYGGNVTWTIDYVDPNGTDVGTTVDSGSFTSTYPDIIWFCPAILPPTLRPRVTLHNAGLNTIIINAIWVGLSHQPNG